MHASTVSKAVICVFLGVLSIGTAQATAVSSSQVTLDLDSFRILPQGVVTLRTPEAYASGGNANARSDPGDPLNPQVNDGPYFGASTWPNVSVSNSSTNALGSGQSDGQSIVVSANASADGVLNREASASAFVHHNIDFSIAAAGDMRFEIGYLVNQVYSRGSATDETVGAYSQVSLQLRRSGFRNGVYFLENLADELFIVNGGLGAGLLTGSSGDLGGLLVLEYAALAASEPNQFYTIEADVYTAASAATRNFVTPVSVPGVGALLLAGFAVLGSKRRTSNA